MSSRPLFQFATDQRVARGTIVQGDMTVGRIVGVDIPTTVLCAWCDGTGKVANQEPCAECRGTGEVLVTAWPRQPGS